MTDGEAVEVDRTMSATDVPWLGLRDATTAPAPAGADVAAPPAIPRPQSPQSPQSPEAVGPTAPPVSPFAFEPFAFEGDRWVEQTAPVPLGGWRRRVWEATGGRVNPGPSSDEQKVRDWMAEVRTPFGGTRTVAVVSTKGGVGKTTTALNLGHALASIRGDRVVALDANPDAGSLGYRISDRPARTAADLLREADYIFSHADVRHFTGQAASTLEVVASPDDPTVAGQLGRRDYERLLNVLRIHYNVVVADCGTGILDEATQGVVQGCDQLVVVTAPGVDAARSVAYLLAWLDQHGLGELAARSVVVVNGVRDGRGPVDTDAMAAHFAQRVRDVVVVPWDAELANGAAVELDWLDPATRRATTRLAATVVRGFTDITPPGGRGVAAPPGRTT